MISAGPWRLFFMKPTLGELFEASVGSNSATWLGAGRPGCDHTYKGWQFADGPVFGDPSALG